MSKSLRLSEKWFRRGLWLVALVFANFLIGLGSTIVGDLPKMEKHRTVSDFLSPPARQLETSIQDNQTELRKLADALEQERLAWSRARADSLASHQTFQNWLATRTATQQSAQDPEVIAAPAPHVETVSRGTAIIAAPPTKRVPQKIAMLKTKETQTYDQNHCLLRKTSGAYAYA